MFPDDRAGEVACPTCAAPRWQSCVNPRNGEEREPHQGRWDFAAQRFPRPAGALAAGDGE